jgi:NADPH:quinone reductase-like Zn-dependent oxidoreductase
VNAKQACSISRSLPTLSDQTYDLFLLRRCELGAATANTSFAAGGAEQIAAGKLHVQIGKTFRLDEIADAHRCTEENKAGGKIVVLT